MDYMNINGNEKAILSELEKYISPEDTISFLRCMPLFVNILEGDEHIKRGTQVPEFGLSLTSPDGQYYINMKYTTIAFICLLLDLKLTKGFATFIAGTFGISSGIIRKLSNKEKCVLLLIKSGWVTFSNENSLGRTEYFLTTDAKCTDFQLECSYQRYNRCTLSNNELTTIINKFLSQNIVCISGQTLRINF